MLRNPHSVLPSLSEFSSNLDRGKGDNLYTKKLTIGLIMV